MSKAFEKNMVTSNPKRTICEVIREIYWHTEDPVIRAKALEASGMAKRMDKKLHEYKYGWDENEWESNPDHEEKTQQRMKQYKEEK